MKTAHGPSIGYGRASEGGGARAACSVACAVRRFTSESPLFADQNRRQRGSLRRQTERLSKRWVQVLFARYYTRVSDRRRTETIKRLERSCEIAVTDLTPSYRTSSPALFSYSSSPSLLRQQP
jgi:hypothetical protein